MFNAARLTQARQRRGWTKRRLADEVGLTDRRIAAFEKGEAEPPESTLNELARVLKFPVDFFYRDDLNVPAVEQVSFRSLAKLTAGRRDAAITAAGIAHEVAGWIDARFELPKPDLPDLREVPPDAAAVALRQLWGLGEMPAPNLVHLLEVHGVRVFSLVDDDRSLDALSTWVDGVPFVFLTQSKSAERARWDAAHELGHLVLHLGAPPQGRQHEDEADEFARNFLLPEAGVRADAPVRVDLDSVRRHKLTWQVSAMAYIRQLREVGKLTEWQYKMLIIEASQAGYRSREGDIERESSQIFPQVIAALRDEGITPAAVASDLAISPTELRGLLFSLTAVENPPPADLSPPERPRLRLIN